MAYLGKTPSQAVRSRYYFTASGSETSLSPTQISGLNFSDAAYVDVSLNGVALVSGTDYTATPSTNTIGGLAALTASDVVEIVVYDTFSVFGGNVNGDFNISGGTLAAEAVTVTGLTTTGDINFGDNDKAIFGAGSDLQIYHDGSHSYIKDAGTGQLRILATDLRINNTSNDKSYITGTDGAEITLYHNGYGKLATTSTGVGVTGSLTASGISVGEASITGTSTFGTSSGDTRFNFDGPNQYRAVFKSSGTIGGQIGAGGADDLRFSNAAGATVVTIKDGNVGIGTSSPQRPLVVSDAGTEGFEFQPGSATGQNTLNHYNRSTASFVNILTNADQHIFGRADGEKMRIDSNGNVGIGNSIPGSFYAGGNNLVVGSGSGSEGITIYGGAESNLFFADGTDIADNLRGRIEYSHGSEAMLFYVNNTYAARFDSNANLLVGRSSDALANFGMTINPAGHIEITRDNAHLLTLNRRNGDGSLIIFAQDNSTEGNITVSGSTVSLTGGHLARWSRLTSGSKDAALVKGTVMTNLDQMVVWHHEAQAATYYTEDDELPDGVSVGDEKTPAVAAYDEDNEQLNCTAISSVEGDPNVAGVFVCWDEDDDFNDMHIAQTGDMVIRIASGTTVARGDLLMSAGDGTAKPQGDDIVRSKTIAKVTSTTVSHTYDDGTFLVPCVLMAC